MTILPFSPSILSSRLIYKLTSTYIGFGCWSFPNFLLSSSKESFVSWITFLIFLIWKKNYKRNKNYTLNRLYLLFIKINVIFFQGFFFVSKSIHLFQYVNQLLAHKKKIILQLLWKMQYISNKNSPLLKYIL